MCGSFIFFLLAGMLVGRLVYRLHLRRHFGRGHGGCGHRHRRRHGAWHRGLHGFHGFHHEQGGEDDPWFGARRRTRWRSGGAVDARRRIEDALKVLELHPRQRAEVEDVLALFRDELPGFDQWPGVDDLLALLAQPAFDRARAAELLPAPPDRAARLADELEHLHIILTEEQRAALAAHLAQPPR